MTDKDRLALSKYLDSHRGEFVTNWRGPLQTAREAARELGISVTPTNVANMMAMLEIPFKKLSHNNSPGKPGRATVIIAQSVVTLLRRLGEPVPEDLTTIAGS